MARRTQYGLFWLGAKPESWFRLRQHGTCFTFSQKICSESKFFVKKMAPFRSFWETCGSKSHMFPKKDIFSALPEAKRTRSWRTA
jgi:hypothetical protein